MTLVSDIQVPVSKVSQIDISIQKQVGPIFRTYPGVIQRASFLVQLLWCFMILMQWCKNKVNCSHQPNK